MKWPVTLLLPILLAPPALAQEPPPAAAPPTLLTDAGDEMPTCRSVLCPGPADTRGDRLSGNHNFDHSINWVSNPLFNIDPREWLQREGTCLLLGPHRRPASRPCATGPARLVLRHPRDERVVMAADQEHAWYSLPPRSSCQAGAEGEV